MHALCGLSKTNKTYSSWHMYAQSVLRGLCK
nr:MAG TPA: Protein of unknown function (DUF1266) [Caudoviricetes sp.]